ncbi:SemiSWEET family sugar transporter [Aquimarina agarivorans]|uniref:SemiSWEET family sugar transporter n=1 Tax=Aquimarina agarivorans TaxID=980584 RepID=UPI000248E713|nr:SemiSWEET transporter [Aquimarina agarivorans]
METNLIEWIGSIAAILTTGSFLPQVYQTWKTKSTESLSLPMFSMFFTGVCLWVYYAFRIDSMPLLIANSITALCSGILLYFKLKYK